MPQTDSQKEWMKKNTIIVSCILSKNRDADLIDYINRCPSRSGEIRRLLRQEVDKLAAIHKAVENLKE